MNDLYSVIERNLKGILLKGVCWSVEVGTSIWDSGNFSLEYCDCVSQALKLLIISYKREDVNYRRYIKDWPMVVTKAIILCLEDIKHIWYNSIHVQYFKLTLISFKFWKWWWWKTLERQNYSSSSFITLLGIFIWFVL